MKLKKIFVLILISALIGFGCSSKRVVKNVDRDFSDSVKELTYAKLQDRDKAIEHFITGQIYEMKGDYASAILEYQDALRYDKSPGIYNALAKAYHQIGKHSLAVEMALEAIKLDSLNISYHETLAEIYIETFEYNKAISELEKILKLQPLNYNALFNLAQLYEREKPLQALELYDRIVENYGPEWNTLQRIAELSLRAGKFSESAKALEMMIEIDPSNYELRRLTAETYINAGNYDKAKAILSDLIEIKPNDYQARILYAELLIQMNEKQKALQTLNQIINDDSADVDVKLRVVEFLIRDRSNDTSFIPTAKDFLNILTRKYPEEWRTHWFLGLIASDERNNEKVFSEFSAVVRLNPNVVEAWRGIGASLYELGRFDELVKWMSDGVKRFPEDFLINFLLGLGYHRLDKNEDAVAPLEKALSIEPKNIDVISTLALVYDAIGDTSKSDSLHELGLKIDPNNHLILNNYSYTLAERGVHLERALEMARKAIEQEPENPAYLDTIGWIYFKLGDYDKALQFIQKAVERGGSAVVIEHLGDVYFKLGDKSKAIEFWKKALDKNPSNEKLKEKINRERI